MAGADDAKAAIHVEESGEGRFVQTITVGRHRLKGDEPRSAGGEDAGPTPYDFLLASLGACTAITLRLYADHKGWPLEKASVELTHAKIHAEDCAECETKEGMLSRIDRRITLQGPLTDEQRQRLLAIANKCPVHRTLTSEIVIRTELAT